MLSGTAGWIFLLILHILEYALQEAKKEYWDPMFYTKKVVIEPSEVEDLLPPITVPPLLAPLSNNKQFTFGPSRRERGGDDGGGVVGSAAQESVVRPESSQHDPGLDYAPQGPLAV